VGKELAVLLERRTGAGAEGTSENYLKVRVSGLPAGDVRGKIVRARLSAAGRVCAGQFIGVAD
jgi:hypothetical protein